MKAKDVALLGFVSAAQEYVKKHMSDGSNLGDLKNIDIRRLKEELFNQLKFFDGTNEEIKLLISAGEDAFNDYKEENLKKTRINIVNLLGNTFEIKDEKTEDLKITIADVKQELKDLDKLKEEGKKQEEKIEEIQEQRIEEAQSAVEKLTEANDVDNSIIVEAEEVQDFGISDDDELFKAISNAASKSDEELASLNKAPEKLNDVYADVVNNENAFKKAIKENKEPSLSEVLKGYGKEEEINEEAANVEPADIQAPINDYPNVKIIEPSKSMINAGSLSASLKNIGATEIVKEAQEQEVSQDINPLASSNPINPDVPQYLQIIENPGVDAVDDSFYKVEEEHYEELKQQENKEIEEAKPIIQEEEKPQEEQMEDDSALEALEALNDFVDKKEKKIIDERPTVKVDTNKPIYDNIASIFPYLSYDFIKEVYADREEIANSYKEGEDVILLHRCYFKDIDNLHEFVEITMSHDYQVNVDEKKMIVDVLRQFENEEGAILSNIYTIANQARVLNGEYEGYRVIVEDRI